MTMTEFFSQPLLVIAAVITLVTGVGRFVRLVVFDAFPPSVAFRVWWDRITKGGPWSKVFNCLWCMAPYAVAASAGWFVLGMLYSPWAWWTWWAVHVFAGLSYAVSILVRRDEPDSE